MKKLKTNLKNMQISNIVFYIFISLFLFLFILNSKLGNMDEIWNFSFARNFAKGLIPYKDFNVISTPLSFIINSIFLKINLSLFTFRIIYFFYYLVIILLLNKILTILKINISLKHIIIFIFTYVLVKICYLDYNFLQLIFILLLIYLSLINPNYENKKINIITSLIVGMTILNKQSTGLVISITNIILILLNKYYFKKNISFLFIIKQIIIMIIPIVLFIIYLFMTNSYNDFYDITILGLTSFSNSLFIPKLFFIVSFLYLFITLSLYLNHDKYELWIIFLYSLASLSCAFPIFDGVHTSFSIALSFLIIGWVINNKIKKIPSIITYCLSIILLILIISNSSSYFKSSKVSNGIYKYIPTYYESEKYINDVDNYILNKSKDYNVYILDMSSSLFYLNIDRYNKYFDIFMNGNFGIYGKQEMLSIIDKDNNLFLINDANNNWQKPQDIIDYVKERYTMCEGIDGFAVYCKKIKED